MFRSHTSFALLLLLTSVAYGGPVVEHGENPLADDDYWERGLDTDACYGFEPAPGMRRPYDCPEKVIIQGFPFYIPQDFPSDTETMVWFQRKRSVMEAILLELSMTLPHFIKNVRESGVGFNWAEAEGPYNFCRGLFAAACYSSHINLVTLFDRSVWVEPHPEELHYHEESGDEFRRDRDGVLFVRSEPHISWNRLRKIVIHELAHAYHAHVVAGGYRNQCVLDAYRFSVERDGKYTEAATNGYATHAGTNVMEYFAEMVTYSMTPLEFRDGPVMKLWGRSWTGGTLGVLEDDEREILVDHSKERWWRRGLMRYGAILPVYDANGAGIVFWLVHRYEDQGWVHYPERESRDGERYPDCDPAEWWPE